MKSRKTMSARRKRKASSTQSPAGGGHKKARLAENSSLAKQCSIQFGFNEKKYSDMELRFHLNKRPEHVELTFSVSRLLLGSRSSHFKTVFDRASDDEKFLQLGISTAEVNLVEPLLRLCYGDPSQLEDLPVCPLLILSERWQFLPLVCEQLKFTAESLACMMDELPPTVLKANRKLFTSRIEELDWSTCDKTLLLGMLGPVKTLHRNKKKKVGIRNLIDSRAYLKIANALTEKAPFSDFEKFCEGSELEGLTCEELTCILRSDHVKNLRSEQATWGTVRRWLSLHHAQMKHKTQICPKGHELEYLDQLSNGQGEVKNAYTCDYCSSTLTTGKIRTCSTCDDYQICVACGKGDTWISNEAQALKSFCSVLRFPLMSTAFLVDIVSKSALAKRHPGVVLPPVMEAIGYHRNFGQSKTRRPAIHQLGFQASERTLMDTFERVFEVCFKGPDLAALDVDNSGLNLIDGRAYDEIFSNPLHIDGYRFRFELNRTISEDEENRNSRQHDVLDWYFTCLDFKHNTIRTLSVDFGIQVRVKDSEEYKDLSFEDFTICFDKRNDICIYLDEDITFEDFLQQYQDSAGALHLKIALKVIQADDLVSDDESDSD